MKKVFSIFLIILVLLLLTGCFEFIQIVSIKNGVINTSIRFSLQKALFEMAASFSDDQVDYDEFLGIGDDTFSQFSSVASEVKKYETPFDIGAEIIIKGSQEEIYSILESEYDFIPMKLNDRYILQIPQFNNEDEEVDEFALVFLSGVKYRIIISLADDLAHITQAHIFKDSGFDGISSVSSEEGCTVSKVGSIMLIEIPMILLILGEGNLFVEFS